MPRRRRQQAGLDFLDDVVDTAVDRLFDRASDLVDRVRDGQRATFTEEELRQLFKCAGCHNGSSARRSARDVSISARPTLRRSQGPGAADRRFKAVWALVQLRSRSAAEEGPEEGPEALDEYLQKVEPVMAADDPVEAATEYLQNNPKLLGVS